MCNAWCVWCSADGRRGDNGTHLDFNPPTYSSSAGMMVVEPLRQCGVVELHGEPKGMHWLIGIFVRRGVSECLVM